MSDTVTLRGTRAILSGRCFGFDSDEAPVYIPSQVLKRLARGGALYNIPEGSQSIPNGYDREVFRGRAAQVLIPGSWHVPRHVGEPLSEQRQRLGELSILTPYEVAVVSQYHDVLKGGRVRTEVECGFNPLTAANLNYVLRRTAQGELHYERQYATYSAPDLGVLIGYRVEVNPYRQ